MKCDYKDCRGIPYAEVFPMNGHWNYLCKKHYIQEYKIHGDEYGWYELTLKEKILAFLTPKWWWFWL